MHELKTGVWHWSAPHPEWEAGHGWDRVVSSYAFDDGQTLVVIDPIAPPPELIALARERELALVLTSPWHVRDSQALSDEFGVVLHMPPADDADPDPITGKIYVAGDVLAFGLEARAGMEPNDLVLWLPAHGALVLGDTLIDRGQGLTFPRDWAERVGDAEQILTSLQPLAELPVVLVLPTHGEPMDRSALLGALS